MPYNYDEERERLFIPEEIPNVAKSMVGVTKKLMENKYLIFNDLIEAMQVSDTFLMNAVLDYMIELEVISRIAHGKVSQWDLYCLIDTKI